MIDILLWGLLIVQQFVYVYLIIVWFFTNTDADIEEEEIEEYEVAKSELPVTFSHFDELKGNPCYSQENSCYSKL